MSNASTHAGTGGDELFTALLIGVGAVTTAVWGGAQLATLATSGEALDTSLGDGLRALVRLPETMGDPVRAWPEPAQAQLPGPWWYWTATATVFAAVCGLGLVFYRAFGSTGIGTDRPDRLGVKPAARFARARDLTPIVVSGPTRGRFILGRVGRHLVATEDRSSQPELSARQRVRKRVGDRSAVAVVGPTRCGKTATVTAGTLDWDAAAILSSVKPDLFHDTVARRRRLGDVFVFDPFGELPEDLADGVTRVAWSPLSSAGTISGAQQAASTLLDAAPSDGVTNASYWGTKGMQLLWPVLYAAAVSGRTMGDVARWMAIQDGDDGESGEIHSLLTKLASNDSPAGIEAKQALTAFVGFWKLDTRTRSDIFSTAQTLITAWDDPYVAAASATSVDTETGELTRPTMTLGRLLRGNNTLYVIQPLGSAIRFSVVFGGLLGDLLRDQAYDISRQAGQPLLPLLAVLDEAGNTPLRWLPQVASTCSGIGVQLVTVWQSLAQMRAIYQAQTDSLVTNHATKVFFSGISDHTTLRYVSDLCGEEEVPNRSSTMDVHATGRCRSVANSTARTKLVPMDLLRQAPEGTALLLYGRLPPAHLTGRRPREERRLRRLTKGLGPELKDSEPDLAILRALERLTDAPAFVTAHMKGVADRADLEAQEREKQAKDFVPAIPEKADADDEESRQVVQGIEHARTPVADVAIEEVIDEPNPDRLHVEEMMGRLRSDQPSPRIEM